MQSTTISLSGNTSALRASFCPDIELDSKYSYYCSLLSLHTYQSIPNINEKNNKLHFFVIENEPCVQITIPIGSYEIRHLIPLIKKLASNYNVSLEIEASENTMMCSIKSNVYIDFSQSNSIGSVFGFEKRVLEPQIMHSGDNVVNIQSVNNIRIDCDLISGSFHNGKPSHTIYEFSPDVKIGRKINEKPQHLIYLPVIKRRINEVNITFTDQNGDLIDFRGETISCQLHIKKEL